MAAGIIAEAEVMAERAGDRGKPTRGIIIVARSAALRVRDAHETASEAIALDGTTTQGEDIAAEVLGKNELGIGIALPITGRVFIERLATAVGTAYEDGCTIAFELRVKRRAPAKAQSHVFIHLAVVKSGEGERTAVVVDLA